MTVDEGKPSSTRESFRGGRVVGWLVGREEKNGGCPSVVQASVYRYGDVTGAVHCYSGAWQMNWFRRSMGPLSVCPAARLYRCAKSLFLVIEKKCL